MTAADRDAAHRAAEAAARGSYGRLLAYLASRFRDVASAEDALAGAFLAALERWPRDGVPTNPDAWLLVAARRRLVDDARHAQVHTAETAERASFDPSPSLRQAGSG